jgi:PQQ-dependent dehydrogenase (methanol/ethanol family)
MLPLALLAAGLSGCGGGGGTSPAPVPAGDWPSYNRDLQSTRYSPLEQITTANAASLHPVCSVRLKEVGALQAGPIVINGTMYVTTATSTYSLDAATCKLNWVNSYTPKDKVPFPVDRGLAIAGNRIVRGEDDGHLISIDATNGKTLWEQAPASGSKGEFLSSAPIIWNNMAFIGTAGSDWGVKGRMMAFDLNTGKRLWTFTTVASGTDPNAKTWQNVRSQETGGGGMWTSYSLDPSTGELFVPVANPAPDFASAYRPGANLYTDSVVVLDAKSGALKWYHQMLPHDVHDWDMSAAPVLVDGNGASPAIVAAASKDGYIYGLDRSTHKLLYKTAGVRIKNFDKPATVAGIPICPGVLGGSEWNGPAYDRKDGLLITPMDDWCATLKLGATRYVPGQFFFGGSYESGPYTSARGTLTAMDAATGKIVWQYHASSPMLGGVTPTAAGVTFTGDMSGNFLVFDSSNGHVLYKNKTQGSIAGGVVTYTAGGKQYVAATSGNISRLTWGAQGKPSIVVYSL